MPRRRSAPTPSAIRAATVEDPQADAWFAAAEAAWAEADQYEPPPLPAWPVPAHVTREVFGRFLLDRDALVVHDAQAALVACDLDAIRNATWFHFWREVPDQAGVPCDRCIPGT